ncbi:hypothetical protein FLSI110296_13305 [Flavobacterium sinopsychrotolerans]|uniref:DUF4878 domain-containing protein n=1 Tax=Flavobacterium sinopsychrotolerans TaxID=604089 RepID=A0A1H8R365_9FLAO|nr:hypothetical protein [Flavobacterium sinopsychrotolerans]SEO60604.1 hypothetical protein SAMN04487942_3182 [Flavobacterium sinopsychrotolerans]
MKLKLLFIMSFFCVFCNTLIAQSDFQGEIIKQCVALPELQKKIPSEIIQNGKEILILNKTLNFTFKRDLNVNNKLVLLVSEQGLVSKKETSYFVFDTISLDGNKSTAVYSFVYQNNNKEIVVPVHLLLEKDADKWKVVNSKID